MKKWKKLLAGLLAMAMVLLSASGYGDEVKAQTYQEISSMK